MCIYDDERGSMSFIVGDTLDLTRAPSPILHTTHRVIFSLHFQHVRLFVFEIEGSADLETGFFGDLSILVCRSMRE